MAMILTKWNKRDLDKTKSSKLNNADENGTLNILNKSKVVDLSVICSNGEVDTLQRISIT